MTVVAAGELDDLRALGERTASRSALIAASVPELTKRTSLDARHRLAYQARELDLERARRAVARAAANLSSSAATTRGCAWPSTSGPQERT